MTRFFPPQNTEPSRVRSHQKYMEWGSSILPLALSALLASGAGCALVAEKQDAAPLKTRATVQPQARTRAIEVVPRYEAMRALRYRDTLDAMDYRKDFTKEVQLEAADALAFARLLEAEPEFTDWYRKRCLPVWDYGLEFLGKKANPGRLVLFSFRCATIYIREPGEKPGNGYYRDFGEEREKFYALFRRLLGPNIYMEDELIHREREASDSYFETENMDSNEVEDWCYITGKDC